MSSSKSAATKPSNCALTACERVFSTTELMDIVLGHVLLHPDDTRSGPCDWYHADNPLAPGPTCCPLNYPNYYVSEKARKFFSLHKVNKTFYFHIFENTRLAQELFLAPCLNPPRLQYVFQSHLFLSADQEKAFDLFCNHRLFRQPHQQPPSKSGGQTDINFTIDTSILALEVGSWTKLQLSQPPTYHIWLHKPRKPPFWSRIASYYAGRNKRVLHCPHGLTLGSIIAAARHVLAEYDDWNPEWEVEICGSFSSNGALREFNSDRMDKYTVLTVDE